MLTYNVTEYDRPFLTNAKRKEVVAKTGIDNVHLSSYANRHILFNNRFRFEVASREEKTEVVEPIKRFRYDVMENGNVIATNVNANWVQSEIGLHPNNIARYAKERIIYQKKYTFAFNEDKELQAQGIRREKAIAMYGEGLYSAWNNVGELCRMIKEKKAQVVTDKQGRRYTKVLCK